MVIELIAGLSISLLALSVSRIAHVVEGCGPSDDVGNGPDVFMIREYFPRATSPWFAWSLGGTRMPEEISAGQRVRFGSSQSSPTEGGHRGGVAQMGRPCVSHEIVSQASVGLDDFLSREFQSVHLMNTRQ
jgi:hypothetical protein